MPRYLISIVGQSNELGSAPTGTKGRTGGSGAPYIDPNNHGWWPSCIESLGRRGVWLDVANTAVGGTSLCDSWVGRCRTWFSGMIVLRGSYALSGGGLWRCALAVGVGGLCGIAPTGTADTTGADSVPWVYVGVPNAGDTDGVIYSVGSPRYDPNAYIATAISALTNKPGYSARGVYVSIGQGDHTVSSTRGQYGLAMQRVAEQFAGLGHVCWLGVTCGMSGVDAPTIASRDATVTGVIQAGRQDALTALAGNPLVRSGADLRSAIGIPAVAALDTDTSAVNGVDYLHLTSATYDQAGSYVAAAFAAGGW